jgi:hypothetical protein
MPAFDMGDDNAIQFFDPISNSFTAPSIRLENGTEVFAVLGPFTADTPESPNRKFDSRTLQVSVFFVTSNPVLTFDLLKDHRQGRKSVSSRRRIFSSSHPSEWQSNIP